MYELIKSCLFLTGLMMIIAALVLLIPEYIHIQSIEQALSAAF